MDTLPGPPAVYTDLEQRLGSKLADLAARIDNLDRTRPVTAVGSGPPNDSSSANGAVRYMDKDGRRFYVYANNQWLSVDSQRYIASAQNTVSVGNGTSTDSDWVAVGPSLTFFVSDPGIVHIYIDAWLTATSWGSGFLTDALFGYSLDGAGSVQAGKNANYNVLEHRVSTSTPGITLPAGGDYPRGAFLMLAVSEGTHTLDLKVRALDATVGTPQNAQAVTFTGRSIRLLIL